MTATCRYCETSVQIQALKRSGETLHECRSELKCLNRLIRRYQNLKRIGNQMANVCYNLSQGSVLHADEREVLAGLYSQWDSAKRR